eukprot:scaffold3890_cov33-Attheya_sp.AAC.5
MKILIVILHIIVMQVMIIHSGNVLVEKGVGWTILMMRLMDGDIKVRNYRSQMQKAKNKLALK